MHAGALYTATRNASACEISPILTTVVKMLKNATTVTRPPKTMIDLVRETRDALSNHLVDIGAEDDNDDSKKKAASDNESRFSDKSIC